MLVNKKGVFLTPPPHTLQNSWKVTQPIYIFFLLFNWIPLFAMLKLKCTITIVAIMAEKAILAILAAAIGVGEKKT